MERFPTIDFNVKTFERGEYQSGNERLGNDCHPISYRRLLKATSFVHGHITMANCSGCVKYLAICKYFPLIMHGFGLT